MAENITIIIEKRSDDFKAYVSGQPGIWGCGKNMSEAIGDVVFSHPEFFGIKYLLNGFEIQS